MNKIAKKLLNLSQIIDNPKIISAMFNGIIPSYARDLLLIKKISHIIPKTIIDVGGHLGQSAKAMNYVFPMAKIHSFEPNMASYASLKNNTKGIKNIFIYPFALGTSNGKIGFWANKFSGASSMLDSKEDRKRIFEITGEKNKIFVEIRRFDSLNIPIEKPLYLKIDVEGAEKQVLRGFNELIKKVDVLQIEYNFKSLYKNQTTLDDIMKYTKLAGLNSFIQLNANSTEKDGLIYCDFIFFRTK